MKICKDLNHKCFFFNPEIQNCKLTFHSKFNIPLNMHLSKDCQLLKAKMRMDDDELIEFEPEKLHNNTIFLDLEIENFPELNKQMN